MSRTVYSHYERRQTYASIRRILERFETHDVTLARMSDLARADGYPTGGDGGGRSKGDHSDPTAAAADARIDGSDDASRAFAALQHALVEFGRAEVLLRRALPSDEAPERKRPTTIDVWCTSCARIRDGKQQLIFEPRTPREGGRRDLCIWCQAEWLGSSEVPTHRKLPDPRLVIAHHAQVRLTEARRREVLALSVEECRSRYLGRDASRTQSRTG